MSPAVFFDVSNKLGTPARLVIELFDNEAPELCQNFRDSCTVSGLTYKSSYLTRTIDNLDLSLEALHGGYLAKSGSTTILSASCDENKSKKIINESIHQLQGLWDRRTFPMVRFGHLCMPDPAEHTRIGQFFISLEPRETLQKACMIIGLVIAGQDFLEELRCSDMRSNNFDSRAGTDLLIVDCGEIEDAIHKENDPAALDSDDRGGRKRRRSTSPHLHDSTAKNLPDVKNKVLRRERRRSDRTIDETQRGRPRDCSDNRHRRSSSVIEEDMPENSHRPRQRSRSPSRPLSRKRSQSVSFRRRRSLPNHYQRRQDEKETHASGADAAEKVGSKELSSKHEAVRS